MVVMVFSPSLPRMSFQDQPDRTRVARPEVLAILDELLASGTIRSVFYVGYAYEAVLRLLHQHLGKNYSVMDWWDRWG